jgi:hypothetical protein
MLKQNFEEKPLTELCQDRHALWETEMELRSSVAGAALYIIEGHKSPNLTNMRQKSALQRDRIRKVAWKKMEIVEQEELVIAEQENREEARRARVTIIYIETEIANLQWKGDEEEYAIYCNMERQISKAIKYVRKGEEAMEEVIVHIISTVNNTLKALVNEAEKANRKDKAAQIRSARNKIAESIWGKVKVEEEKPASQHGDREPMRLQSISLGYEAVIGYYNAWYQPRIRRIGGTGVGKGRADMPPRWVLGSW